MERKHRKRKSTVKRKPKKRQNAEQINREKIGKGKVPLPSTAETETEGPLCRCCKISLGLMDI